MQFIKQLDNEFLVINIRMRNNDIVIRLSQNLNIIISKIDCSEL